ncbi:MAG: DUF3883 domain-containing protein, partial [Alphaproteobacteria bacterium]|nr:DUF3883 domain-containing protein [Alphaproteobacteria bacterium]
RTKYAEYLYNTLFDKSIEEQEKFETERYQFERNLPEIPNTHNFDPANILPIPEYKNTHPFSDNITRENHEKLKKLCPRPEQLAELLSKEVNYSLLSFGHIDLLKERYDKLVEQNEKLSETDTEFDPLKTDVQILEMEVYTPTETTNKQPQNHTALHQKNTQKAKHQYSAKADIQKQKHGFEAELHAYHTLKDMYGEKNVRWLSGNAVKAGVLIGGGDDSLGYDMTYTDSDGNVQFVEVKSATHIGGDTYSFILTDNEEQTATENIDNYSIFLVIDDKIKVITADALIHNLLPNAKTDQKTVFYP